MAPSLDDDTRTGVATNGGTSKRAASPEPLSEGDILAMRHRVQEILSLDSGSQDVASRSMNNTGSPHNTSLSVREKELVDMVIRYLNLKLPTWLMTD